MKRNIFQTVASATVSRALFKAVFIAELQPGAGNKVLKETRISRHSATRRWWPALAEALSALEHGPPDKLLRSCCSLEGPSHLPPLRLYPDVSHGELLGLPRLRVSMGFSKRRQGSQFQFQRVYLWISKTFRKSRCSPLPGRFSRKTLDPPDPPPAARDNMGARHWTRPHLRHASPAGHGGRCGHLPSDGTSLRRLL